MKAHLTRLILVCLLSASALLLPFAGSASAAPYAYNPVQSEALSAGVPGGGFVEPFSLTFDAAGNLYVADPRGDEETGVIDKFDAENAFTAQLGAAVFPDRFLRGIAVNDETGHLYAGYQEAFAEPPAASLYALDAAGAELSHWHGAETPPGAFSPGYVSPAVDNSPGTSHGDIYLGVPREGGGEVDVFESQEGDAKEGKFLRTLEAPPEGFSFEGEPAIAVDGSSGQVYLVNTGHKVVDRYSPAGAYETRITGTASGKPFNNPVAVAVAVNAAHSHVFVVDHGAGGGGSADFIDEFDAAGQLVNQITGTATNEPITRAVGVAVQEAGPHAGEVYVTDASKGVVDVFAERAPAAPLVLAAGVKDLGEHTATFLGELNPEGLPTEYRFQYGPCASAATCSSSAYSETVPVPDALLGAEGFSGAPTAGFPVFGLLGATTYHFRLLAHNAVGDATGEERTFTTQGALSEVLLPDGRQWELVSPPVKGSAQVGAAGEVGLVQAAADGSAVTYLSNAPTGPSPSGAAGELQVLSARGGSGWGSRSISTPHEAATGVSSNVAPEYRFFSDDLDRSIVQPYGLFNLALSREASEQTAYLHQLGSCTTSCFQPLVTGKSGFANVPPETVFGEELLCEENNGVTPLTVPVCGPLFQGASPDAGHVVVRSAVSLILGAPAGQVSGNGTVLGSLYEWSAGQLQLVSILPPNEAGEELPAPVGASVEEEPLLGAQFAFGIDRGTARRAISEDGSRIFFESGHSLYVRDTALEKSLQVDAPDPGCAGCEGEGGGARFQIASADGSRVFFLDAHRLTEDAGAHAGAPDLYECRIGVSGSGALTCALTDLTPSEGGESANVQGDILGASEDGSAIYFVADGTLALGGVQRGNCANIGETPQAPGAQCNLYLKRDGQPARLVTELSGRDAKVWTQRTARQLTRVSPDGRYLAFLSERSLTGYDNADALSGRPDAEVFFYDAGGSGALSCASCMPSGARPAGVEYNRIENGESQALPGEREEWEVTGWVAALLPRTSSFSKNQPSQQPRYLSNSGRLYFNALDGLVPSDTNGVGDVYQYEPAGVGTCTTSTPTYSPAQGGCIDLISSGTSPERAVFLDASESGDDVFFLTTSRLSPLDVDNQQDVYDAHVCGGGSEACFPEPTPPEPPCSGEACQGAPGAAPAEAAPQSQAFSGPGNPKPKRKHSCPKGKVRKGGKCTKKQQKKQHHKAQKHGHSGSRAKHGGSK